MAAPKLRPFQRQGVDFLRASGYTAGLFDGMGLGKTIQILVALSEARQRLLPALVVAPASVAHNWTREAAVWCPGVRSAVVTGPKQVAGLGLAVCTWDYMSRASAAFLKASFRTVIFDEAHYAKNPEARRSQSAQALAQVTKHRLLLTGTPLVNNEAELDTLHRLLGSRDPPILRRLFEDVVFDVPPKTRVYLPVTLSKSARKEYDAADGDFGAYLNARLKVASEAGNAELAEEAVAELEGTHNAQALQRVGYLRRILGRGKAPAAAEWAASMVMNGEPVVIFAEHAAPLDIIEKRLRARRIRPSRLDGSTPKKARQAMVDRFQQGLTPVFLASRAGAEGITLTRACNLLFAERYWTSSIEEQIEDRIRRISQTRRTTIWYAHAEGTFDDRVRDIVDIKRGIVSKHIRSAEVTHGEAEKLEQVARNLRLPRARNIAAVSFRAPWTPGKAAGWLRMQGYKPRRVEPGSGFFRVVVRDYALFEPGSFSSRRISKDCKIVLGMPRRKARKLRAQGKSTARYRLK